eukprot:g9726.t1
MCSWLLRHSPHAMRQASARTRAGVDVSRRTTTCSSPTLFPSPSCSVALLSCCASRSSPSRHSLRRPAPARLSHALCSGAARPVPRLRQRLREGHVAVGVWQMYAQPLISQLLAHTGYLVPALINTRPFMRLCYVLRPARDVYDTVVLDLQHGMMDFGQLVPMLTALHTAGPGCPTALVRVPSHDASLITKVLDAGAEGVICPMVESAEQAQQLVAACLYPPLGSRSFGPVVSLGQREAPGTYLARSQQQVLVYAMIETQQGLRQLERICATPRLDGLFIGPMDLAISLGRPPSCPPSDPAVLAAISDIVSCAHRHGKSVAMYAAGQGTAAARIAADLRLDWVVSASDQGLLLHGAAQNLADARQVAQASKTDEPNSGKQG